jgi:epoxyqueuosine reductase
MSASLTHQIKQEAKRLGFDFVGISKAEKLDDEAPRLERWLLEGKHGKMEYMERYFDLRLDPSKLVPGAQSIISLAYNYYTKVSQEDPQAPKLSIYAFGKDYHYVVKEKLKELLGYIRNTAGVVSGRCFVDSAPVLERDWAKRSGLGWIGKNTLLINPKQGSYFFLAEIILDLKLEPDYPIRDHCGTCTRCIDACPTDAISSDGYIVDGSKCISYLTIELKESIPEEFSGKMENWMFGCDICQQVCPWNRFSKPHHEPQFNPKGEIIAMSRSQWEELTETDFSRLFKKSAVKRTKYQGLKRNIAFLKGDSTSD